MEFINGENSTKSGNETTAVDGETGDSNQTGADDPIEIVKPECYDDIRLLNAHIEAKGPFVPETHVL